MQVTLGIQGHPTPSSFLATAKSTGIPTETQAAAETRFERGDERAVAERSPGSLMAVVPAARA